MITRHLITQRAHRDGVDATVVERDYVLAHIVAQLGHCPVPARGKIIFKGGTALRLIHADNYRYSADLDFSLVDCGLREAYEVIAQVLGFAKSHAGFPVLGLTDDANPRVTYVGPLGAKPRELKLDISDDEYVEGFIEKPIKPLWEDLPAPAPLTVYSLEEIAAEKLRCIMQRLQCRDFFDLHEISLNLGVKLTDVRKIFEAKARARGIDSTMFSQKFEERVPRYQDRWQKEMREHIAGGPPEFKTLERALRRELRMAGMLGA